MIGKQQALLLPPMYKRLTQYFSPGQTAGTYSIKNLIWPPDPLNEGKNDFLLHY